MARKVLPVRARRDALAAELRAEGMAWVQIAAGSWRTRGRAGW